MCAESTATVYTDTHLDADKALNCPIALAYFIKAFAGLTEEARTVWLNTVDAEHRYELGSLALSLGVNRDFMFYIALEQAGVENDDLDLVFSVINTSLNDTPFNDAEYRETYMAKHSKKLAQMMEQYRAEQNGEVFDSGDDDDSMIDQLMSLL